MGPRPLKTLIKNNVFGKSGRPEHIFRILFQDISRKIVIPQTCCAVRGSYGTRKRIRSKLVWPVVCPVLKLLWGSRCLPMWLLAGSPKFSKINKDTKMFTKWVAMARKSLLTIDFCIIFRDTADGDIFGQKS